MHFGHFISLDGINFILSFNKQKAQLYTVGYNILNGSNFMINHATACAII